MGFVPSKRSSVVRPRGSRGPSEGSCDYVVKTNTRALAFFHDPVYTLNATRQQQQVQQKEKECPPRQQPTPLLSNRNGGCHGRRQLQEKLHQQTAWAAVRAIGRDTHPGSVGGPAASQPTGTTPWPLRRRDHDSRVYIRAREGLLEGASGFLPATLPLAQFSMILKALGRSCAVHSAEGWNLGCGARRYIAGEHGHLHPLTTPSEPRQQQHHDAADSITLDACAL